MDSRLRGNDGLRLLRLGGGGLLDQRGVRSAALAFGDRDFALRFVALQ